MKLLKSLRSTTLIAFVIHAFPASNVSAQVAPAAAAAPGAPHMLEPLRVTADLWETPLGRVPASVSVYDEQALRSSGVRHFADLVDQIPNLTWTGGTTRPRYFQIRGIGENSQFEGETPDSTVRFLLDDLDFTGLGGAASAFDVRQIEVLRGPQAGAFGANAAGGLVRVVTNAPTPFWTGQVEATAGGDDLFAGGFAVGGPLSRNPEQLMTRLAVHRHSSDGYRRNLTVGRDTNARDELNARLRFTANPSAEWRWEAALLFSDVDNGYDEYALDNNGRHTFSDQPGRDEQRSQAASLRGTFSGLAGLRVTSVTSGNWTDSAYSYDDDWTAASYAGFSDLRRDRFVFGQELRLDSTRNGAAAGAVDRWTLGLFLSQTDETSRYTNEDPENLRGLRTTYDGVNQAAFGQVALRAGEATRVIVGLRAERVDLDGAGTRTRFRKVRGTFDPQVSFAPRFDDTVIGGKLTLEHDFNRGLLGFASLTRGYKAGGINIDARISPPADPLTYETEYLWNYEAGLRGSWLDRRLSGEVTAFYTQRRDTQVRDSAGFGGSYRFFTDNGGDAHVYGLESSGTFAFTPHWTVHGSLGLMESELEPFVLGNGSAGGGRELANTPRYGYTIGTRYRADRGLFANAELVGRARHFDSNNHNEIRRSFNVVNASVGYAWNEWTFTVWARNVFDRVYDKRVYFFGNEDPDYIPARYESRADPRQVGVTAAYRW